MPSVPARSDKIPAEVLRYALASGFSFVWILGTSALCVEVIGLAEQVGVAIALLSALVINFTLLRTFVFPGQEAGIGAQFAATAVTSLTFRVLEYGLYLVLAEAAGLHYLPATALAVICSALGKFFVYRNVVFRRPGDSVV